MTKIVPSPDWFVGLDSLQLCNDGHFIQSFATEVPTTYIKPSLRKCKILSSYLVIIFLA